MPWVVMTTRSRASAFTSPLAGAIYGRGQRVRVRLVGAEGAGWGATIPPSGATNPGGQPLTEPAVTPLTK